MKKCLCSKYIQLSQEDFNEIKEDIILFNNMKRMAFCMIKDFGGDIEIPANSHFNDSSENKSIHLILKDKYQVNDYFRNSAREEGKDAFKSAMECLKLQQEELESQISQMSAKIKKESSRLKHLLKEKESLIKRSKGKKVKFASYRGGNESEVSAGKFQVRRGKNKYIYENQYLFEIQYLNPEIKKLKHRICMIESRCNRTQSKLNKIKMMISEHNPSVCFGSKNLFYKQYSVYKNEHLNWKNVFDKRRSPGMTITGRKDAKQGNFVFKYDTKTNHLTYTSMKGKTIILPNVVFPYGQNYVDEAVMRPKKQRTAIAWRLELSGNDVLVKCMIELPEIRKNDYYADGCISFDMNVDNISVSELDRNGNLLMHKVIPFHLDYKTSGQRTQLLSLALDEVFHIAQKAKKPVAMEDISKIKQEYLYQNKKLNRILSSFAYQKIDELTASKSYKYGIGVYKVNPAFTSQIGKIKYMRHYGLTVHEAASFVIGRRAMGFSEKLPRTLLHLIPQKNLNKHHWSHWRFLTCHIKKYDWKQFYQFIPYHTFEDIKNMSLFLTS